MKILVTGGAGFVGSILAPMLLAEGHRVMIYDNLMFGLDGILGCFNDPKFEFMEGDIRDKDTLKKAVDGCDAIVHLAAHVGFPICKKDPDEAQKVICETCKYFRLTVKHRPYRGACHFNAPVAGSVTEKGSALAARTIVWPVVRGEDFCSEHTPK